MEVLAGLGAAAAEIWRYNRENYEFDQEQRIEREELRLKMQVERFSLFREDVRDLVELTVGKMDLYHIVGALFVKACVVYYCEGLLMGQPPPVYLLTLYYLSNAGSMVYLVLGVWLSMHASISSHSHGTKLLTRFVRLPIPGTEQLRQLNQRMADFERQGIKQQIRVPFLNQHQEWKQKAELEADHEQDSRPASSSSQLLSSDFLEQGEKALNDDDADELLQAVEMRTQRHVQLFRKLQARWQCYDAYARVCMSLGVRQLIQTITYFVIGVTLVEEQHHMNAYVLVVALQAIAFAICALDIHSRPCYWNLDMSVVAIVPAACACLALSLENGYQRGRHLLDKHQWMTLIAFPCEILFFEQILSAASPTDNEAALPRHFNAVLFMDVFGEVDDPTEADFRTGARILTAEQRKAAEAQLGEAIRSLSLARAAWRRWGAVPRECLSTSQERVVDLVRGILKRNIRELEQCLDRYKMDLLTPKERNLHPFSNLSQQEQDEDPFKSSLLGPFDRSGGVGYRFFDLESHQMIENGGFRCILTIEDLVQWARRFEHDVNRLYEVAGGPKKRKEVGSDGSDSEVTSLLASPRAGGTYEGSTYADGSRAVRVKPARLPWKLVRSITRFIQLVWGSVFLVQFLESINEAHIDSAEVNIVEWRRLVGVEVVPWQYELVDVDWPMGGFFRPEMLACQLMPLPKGVGIGRALLVSSPFAHYRAVQGSKPLELEELLWSGFIPGITLICGHAPVLESDDVVASDLLSPGCLLGAPTLHGVAVRPLRRGPSGVAAMLEVKGAPWRLLAGVSLPCKDIGLIHSTPPSSKEGTVGMVPAALALSAWCLLLVGWTGGEELTIATVPLEAGPASLPQHLPGRRMTSLYELPLMSRVEVDSALPVHQTVAAMHVEVESRNLWVLMNSGDLRAWNLMHGPPRFLGRWPAQRPTSITRFRAVAACEDASGRGIFVAGHSNASFAGAPVLLRVVGLPRSL